MQTIQLVLTEKCNLNCYYCYMNNRETAMSKSVWYDIYHSLGYEEFEIDLFGGEPLLQFNLIKTIYETLQFDYRCKKINLFSNGTLITKDKEKFIEYSGINFTWSFDGLWQDGGWSVQYLKKNMLTNITNNLSCMIPPNRGIHTIRENYNFFLNTFQIIPDFKIVKDNIWTMEDVEKFEKEFKELCVSYRNRLVEKHENCLPGIISHYLALMIDGWLGKRVPDFCGAGHDHIAYMPNGSKVKCARFGSHPINFVCTGMADKCRKCEIGSICEKGCFHDNQSNGCISIELCNLYKAIYKQVGILNNELKNNSQWKENVKKIIKGEKI